MKLTSKGRYAMTAMLDIAAHQDQGPIALAEISERQSISLSYLEQLFSKLKRANLVESARGPGGGYRLARDAEMISARDVILAVDEKIEPRKCEGKENCCEGGRCLSHGLWEELSEMIESFLDGISLARLLEKTKTHQVVLQQDIRFNLKQTLVQ
jgi:Rrf2 family iron-sulfur cluster assembly transcriptional regulator